jgi:hypothetical protein
MFSDAIGVMLLIHDHYRDFNQRPIGDARRESQVLLALSVDNRDAVDATLTRAVAAGGSADPNPLQERSKAAPSAWLSRCCTCRKAVGLARSRIRTISHRPSAAHHVDGGLAAMFRRNLVSLRAATRTRRLHIGVSRGRIGGLLVGRDSRRIIIAAVAIVSVVSVRRSPEVVPVV